VIEQTRQAVSAGVDVIQVRERDLEARQLVALVASVVQVTRGSRTKVVVNDRVDVALAAGADGVHLRGDSLDVRQVRAIAPSPFIVGRSVHSVAEARAAGPVDYLIAGTAWPTQSHLAEWRVLGLEGLKAVSSAVEVPVIAIGGISPERFAAIAATGAAGVAGIGLFMGPTGGCRAQRLHGLALRFRAAFAGVTFRGGPLEGAERPKDTDD
jgi:thiamine-phosphate pyrophosphorylase